MRWKKLPFPSISLTTPHTNKISFKSHLILHTSKLDRRNGMALLNHIPTWTVSLQALRQIRSINLAAYTSRKGESTWHANLTWSVLRDINRCHSTTTFPTCASNLSPCKKARDTTDPDFEFHNKEATYIYIFIFIFIFLGEMLFTSTWSVYFICVICYLCPPQTEQLPVLITLSPYPLKIKLLIETQVMIQAHTLICMGPSLESSFSHPTNRAFKVSTPKTPRIFGHVRW